MPRRRIAVLAGFVAGVLVASAAIIWLTGDGEPAATQQVPSGPPPSTAPIPTPVKRAGVALPRLDLSKANRREPIPGLPDWSRAGYRGGEPLPDDSLLTPDDQCRIEPEQLAEDYDVRPGDGTDDSAGLQDAIDTIRERCTPSASYERLSLIELPAGVLDVSRQLAVDADFLVIRGAGSDPVKGTRFVFRPDQNTRYDALTADGSDWDEDAMGYKDGEGGWIWPGRGLFRVQSRQVHEDYQDAYDDAPANRKDLFQGTVNVHWKAGVKLRDQSGGFAARAGDRVVYLADDAELKAFKVGGYVNIRAANTMRFYEQQQALPTDHELQNLHMRQQIFGIIAIDPEAHTITLDKPLEFDVPVSSTSEGSAEIGKKKYDSKASPLVDPVLGVGLEYFSLTQPAAANQQDATHNYGNLAPADALHGIVLKWTVDSWVRGIRTTMTGSHPIVTEEAKNLQIQGNYLDGAWNKGKGGNGYLRGSRVWDSVYAGNVLRGLRHLTLQWSSSGNVVIGNDMDADLNLHGGWERRNLFELNTVRLPYEHRPGSCRSNCGDEGGSTGAQDDSTWYPVWWGAGRKAVKWSGATGPQNVFFGNDLAKQLTENGRYVRYLPDQHRVYQFGWDGTSYRPLSQGGQPIADWAGNERADYTRGDGVEASRTDPGRSLFLKRIG